MPINLHGLAHILQQQTVFTTAQTQTVITQAHEAELPLLHYLISEKILKAQQIAQTCADYFRLMTIDFCKNPIDTSVPQLVTHPFFLQYAFLLIEKNATTATIAISDPRYIDLATDLKFQLNVQINIVFAPYDQLIAHLNPIISQFIYQATHVLSKEVAAETAIVDVTNQIITDAIYRTASDIHFEFLKKTYRVRMRIDGILHTIVELSITLSAAISSRLKIMANLDIAEKRLPQDGRFTFTTITGIGRDCRISSCPTLFGEKIVLRLLNPNKNLLQVDELGLAAPQKKILLQAISEPQGLILVTGPTGSGKTITLYTALNRMNTVEKNIYTIEDPIEIHLPGINQVNVNLKAGLNFSTALRAFLRQDPDIIMVGEIRDFETASMAIRAALTGHLVLSTLHTNNAAEALTRLVNMGIKPFNIASTVTLIIAQRLVRLLCVYCSGLGCPSCLLGFKGRTAIFEVIPINAVIRELILSQTPASVIAQTIQQNGIADLWQGGLDKVAAGQTSLTELHRVLSSQN